MESIFNPPIPMALDEFYKIILSVSGVLFGIAFAAMLFVLQSGFTSFKYSRRMFLGLYLHFGRQLLYALAYLTAAPLFMLSFENAEYFVNWIYALFLVCFMNASLDYAKEEGYIITINSSKYVPRSYGRVRAYFRLIYNRGFLKNLFSLVPIFCLLLYPYLISIVEGQTVKLSQDAVFYSCLTVFVYSLYKITKFIPEFFIYTDMELASSSQVSNEEQSEEEKSKNFTEGVALKEYLIKRGVKELEHATSYTLNDGELTVNFTPNRDRSDAWFNIYVAIRSSSPASIRQEVLIYAYKLAKLLHLSKAEVNVFVLSFHIDIKDDVTRSMFFRFDRPELDKIFAIGKDDPENMAKIKNVLFDELFKR